MTLVLADALVTIALGIACSFLLFVLRRRVLRRLLEPRWHLWSRTALEREGVPPPFVPYLSQRLEGHYRSIASELAGDIANVGPPLALTFTALLLSLPLVADVGGTRSRWAWSAYVFAVALSLSVCALLWVISLHAATRTLVPVRRKRAHLVPDYRVAWRLRPMSVLSLSNYLGCVPALAWLWWIAALHGSGS